MKRQFALLLAILSTSPVLGKIFDRCELARELSKEEYRIPRGDIATWVCIARHESDYNSSAVGHVNLDSEDHGIFQISDLYWCSPPGVGTACGLGCDLLEDDDLSDDVSCAIRIHRAHRRRSGDGFTAWAVYRPFCRGDVKEYIQGCDLALYTVAKNSRESKDYISPQEEKKTTSISKTTPRAATLRKTKTTTSPDERGKYTSSVLKKPYKTSHDEKLPDNPVPFPHSTLGNDVPTSYEHSRSLQTGLLQRPTSRSGLDPRSGQDPRTAWFGIHYNPRFLDEVY